MSEQGRHNTQSLMATNSSLLLFVMRQRNAASLGSTCIHGDIISAASNGSTCIHGDIIRYFWDKKSVTATSMVIILGVCGLKSQLL